MHEQGLRDFVFAVVEWWDSQDWNVRRCAATECICGGFGTFDCKISYSWWLFVRKWVLIRIWIFGGGYTRSISVSRHQKFRFFCSRAKLGLSFGAAGERGFLFSHHSFVSRLFLCDKIINCCTHLTLFACYKTTGVRRKRCNIGCWNLGFKQDGRFRRFVLLKSTCWEFCEYKRWWRSINVKWRQCK